MPFDIGFQGVNGDTNLGIEINGVVTTIAGHGTILSINSLDDVFIVGAANASNSAESFEIELFDNAGTSTGKVQLDMTTGPENNTHLNYVLSDDALQP